MSLIVDEEINCPCGKSFMVQRVRTINAESDPDLAETFLNGGDPDPYVCESCCQQFLFSDPVLFNDQAHRLMINVYPDWTPEESRQNLKSEDQEKMKSLIGNLEEVHSIGEITFDVVFGIRELRERLDHARSSREE